MKEQELLGHLLDLARRQGFEVRTDQGPFRDGYCRLPQEGSRIPTADSQADSSNSESPVSNPEEDRRVIVLNRNSPAARRISALAQALKTSSLEGTFLLPAVREAIDNAFETRPQDTSAGDDSSQAASEESS